MPGESTAPRIFQAESFCSTKEWIYFCLEYDLEICEGCRRRSRKRRVLTPAGSEWYCDECEPSVHPDLWRVLRTRENVLSRCDLCEAEIPIRECWISDDCLRLYCAHHLQPLEKKDRIRLVRDYLGIGNSRRSNRLEDAMSHLSVADCDRCTFNGKGIYDRGRLVELEFKPRRCVSAPDTLNCADLES